ncbi:Uncharacterized protein Adt_06632 [Abeliophyllum distichum]|uniref:Uncharacterized protein n=1 Tax=Abeliophyllum distichum TaxID=126358 RepID=A0ABD1V7F3_9LAMI
MARIVSGRRQKIPTLLARRLLQVQQHFSTERDTSGGLSPRLVWTLELLLSFLKSNTYSHHDFQCPKSKTTQMTNQKLKIDFVRFCCHTSSKEPGHTTDISQ